MSTDEFSTEMELYGVSPGIIAFIIVTVTIIFPLGYIPGFFIYLMPGIYGVLWILANPYFYLPLCLLNIFFAYKIVKYYQGKSRKNTVLFIGILSLLLPTAVVLYLSGLLGSYVIIYPIPVQFVVGIYLLYKIEGPEVISPWSGLRLDMSWWKWKGSKTKRKDDWEPFEEEKKAV